MWLTVVKKMTELKSVMVRIQEENKEWTEALRSG